MIERQIIIAAITSTEYLQECRSVIHSQYVQATVARLLLGWCLEYYDKHQKAPQASIETIYFEKLKIGNIPKEVSDELEGDILPELSTEYEKTGLDLPYVIQETHKYFKEQKLLYIQENLETLVSKGRLEEAENLLLGYKPVTDIADQVIMNSKDIKARINEALSKVYEPLIEYSGALGTFWNHQLVRGGFIAFLAPEKRGKSIVMMDMAVRGAQQNKNVAFFQAGDMTTDQQLRRISIRTTGKPDNERHTGVQYFACRDCVRNQLNTCNKSIRECNFGVLEDMGWNEKQLRYEVNFDILKEAADNEPTYEPCYNCKEWEEKGLGAVWLKKTKVSDTLSITEAEDAIYEFFHTKNRPLRISTHPNGTLTVKGIREVLNTWALEGWVPDIIIIDYADLLEDDSIKEYRHKQNRIWKDLRGLNQELNCLLITATQADANAYDKDTLSLKNFSEDKRKFAHVTAFYGLNQDRTGREKKLGVLRINELLLREGEYDTNKHVTILQNLQIGRPMVASYF